MMGYYDAPQENLFQYHAYLEDRVRRDHPYVPVEIKSPNSCYRAYLGIIIDIIFN